MAPGDMVAASLHKQRKPLPSSQKELQLKNDLASAATDPAPSGEAGLIWKRPYGIGAGLQNMGNTCYMNATLQCLTYTPPLANYMLSQAHSQTCRPSGFCMLCAVETHFLWALHSPGDVIQPCQALAAAFHRNRQEDAHEFLVFTVDALKAAGLPGLMNVVGPKEDKSLSHQIFGGYWKSQIKCLQCQGVSDTLDPYLDIALDIKTADSVQQALEQLVKPEELDGENAYECGICLKKTAASKTLVLQSSGNVLIFVLKRFSDFTGEKIARQVQYPECLDMRPYMSQQSGRPLEYVLYAALVHVGLRCQKGHYFCYVKAGNGHWYKMDDAKVTACDITSVLNQSAYVLFYVQKSEFGGENGTVSPGRGPSVFKTEDRPGNTPRQLERHCSVKAVESEERPEKTTQEFTLDQWKSLQDQNRPKCAFTLRKVEPSLPCNAILIHQSRSTGRLRKQHPELESSLQHRSAGPSGDQVTTNPSNRPCPGGRTRPPKRKNKHGKRPLLVFQ
ncbi:ubiquitin carboxyl-terminal hydrolase 17-like protein 6 [Oryctolagus cuniculus]|nr:ubiquitin carboxyl-terminal hydrolase 17-like protein 6 [Oryctolagus cuniculus]